jgi:hypothetical protein
MASILSSNEQTAVVQENLFFEFLDGRNGKYTVACKTPVEFLERKSKTHKNINYISNS